MSANNTNIPPYSAADLVRYASGRMSAPEMYALEKAAQEDPFLAEALDGYMEAFATQKAVDIEQQIKRLPPKEDEKEKARIVPFWQRKAVQIAIAACFLVGGGWFVFSLLNKQEVIQNDVAVSNKIAPAKNATADSVQNSLALDSSLVARGEVKDSQYQSPLAKDLSQNHVNTSSTSSKETETFAYNQSAPAKEDSQPALGEIAASPVQSQPATFSRKLQVQADSSVNFEAKAYTMRQDSVATSTGVLAKAKTEVNSMPYAFKGRITDAHNNPLPYASIMITGENIGTYTDANGNFNFISVDSTLLVRTKSLGYVSQSQTIKANQKENKIVLQEDEKLKSNLAVTQTERQQRNYNYRPTIVERDSIEGSLQPKIGYTDYNLYLANNNRLNEIQALGQQVRLSFELDKNGNATNITIEKSAGQALDQEAIRLLKEGPKWNGKKGKKGKITVKF